MKFFYVLAPLLFLLSNPAAAQQQNYKVIAYYTGDGDALAQHPLEKLTHVIYSFMRLKNDTLTVANEKQAENLKKIVAYKKQFPHLKIMVSIGGWGGCAPCSDLFASAQHRKTFAQTTVALFEQYGVDGLDLDWEYPAIEGYPGHKYTPEDRQNFTELVKTLRQEMGNKYLLTFAAGGFDQFLEESVDWAAIMPHLDFVNLMTYDLTSGFSKYTGHHTPLHSNKKQKQSTSNCVQWLLRHGVPSEKLIIGAAFYARVWEDVRDVEHGLFQSGQFITSVPYKNFDTYFSAEKGYRYYFDKKSKAPYFYSAKDYRFATFDDKKSIALKVKYLKKKQLGGIMFWELSQDTRTDGLVEEIDRQLKGE